METNMQVITLISGLQHTIIFAIVTLICGAALGTAIGFAILGSKFLESAARQPEIMGQLQGRMLIIAGLLDAVSMIGVGVALFFTFANPFVPQLLQHIH